jgi:hypothetical protein
MCNNSRGTYDLKCLDCCARLIASTYPDKSKARGMKELVKRFIVNLKPCFTIEQVMERTKEVVESKK